MGLIRTLHAWAGAILSLILIVLGLTGALLAFKTDFVRLTVPAARAAAASSPAAIGKALEAIEAAHGPHVHHVIFASPRLGVHQVFLHGEAYAYVDRQGRTVAAWTGAARTEEWVYELHHFLLSGENGMKVVGFTGLCAVVLALTGLIVWTPVFRTLRLRWWPASSQRRDLIAAHRNLGVVFALPIIVFCLTGAGMIFFRTTEAWLTKLLPGPAAEEFFPPVDAGDIDWPKALASAQAAYPKAQLRAAIWPEGIWAPAIVRMRQPGEWSADGHTSVLIDPSTGRSVGSIDPMVLARGKRLNDALLPIHAAQVGGRLYDLVTAFSGLALAGLGGLGLWSFLIKPRRRRKEKGAAAP
jgi:uncharacterized iron-regulated membrane protein